jgi:hypothetical protein
MMKKKINAQYGEIVFDQKGEGVKNVDKNVSTKIKEVTAYHSMGYSPRFIRCPNCENSVLKSWEKPKECSYCNQKLLWD